MRRRTFRSKRRRVSFAKRYARRLRVVRKRRFRARTSIRSRSRRRLSSRRRLRTRTPSRAALFKTMAPAQRWLEQIGQSATPTVWTVPLTGMLTWYFGANRTEADGTTQTPNANSTFDVLNILRIAQTIDPSVDQTLNASLLIQKTSLRHIIHNRSNFDCDIQAFYCIVRRDVPNQSSHNNAVQVLQDGLFNTGISSMPATLNRAELTPYDSPGFTAVFKILRVRKRHLIPGGSTTFNVSSKGRMISTARLIAPTSASDTYTTSPQVISWIRGSKFILFKLSTQLARDAGSSGALTSAHGGVDMVTMKKVMFKYFSRPDSKTYLQSVVGITTNSNTPVAVSTTSGASAAEVVV